MGAGSGTIEGITPVWYKTAATAARLFIYLLFFFSGGRVNKHQPWSLLKIQTEKAKDDFCFCHRPHVAPRAARVEEGV